MNIRRLILFLMLAVLWVAGAEQASAFYNPGTGRWLSRDPIKEVGFEVMRTVNHAVPSSPDQIDDGDGDGIDGIPGMSSYMDSEPQIFASNLSAPSVYQNSARVMDYEWNRYYFVLNNPINNTDALGLDITVETGNNTGRFANDAFHQQICVGCGDSRRCFSFGKLPGLSGFQKPQFSRRWLGWSSWVTGGILRGEVYEADPVQNATIYSRHKTNAWQDNRWLEYELNHRVGLQDAYSVGRHNCRTYSQWEFRDAPSHW